MYVLGIDPGADHKKHSVSERGTGWALMWVPEDNKSAPELLESGHVIGGPDAFLNELCRDSALRRAIRKVSHLVLENFKLFDKNADPGPLEIIGMIKLWCRKFEVQLVLQMPGERGGVTHDDLKRIGMWPGGRGHADTAQAIRHVLSWLMKQRHMPTMMLVSPPPED